MPNPFLHVELHTGDVRRARAFYKELFGWDMQRIPTPIGMYTLIKVGQGTGGGIMANDDPAAPAHWLAYVGVDDIAATSAEAVALGATLVHPITKVSVFGSMCVLRDPQGAHVALWQTAGGVW